MGYWLEQQGVERGSQPWYYYAFLQIPVYEFLPAMGCLIGRIPGLFRKFGGRPQGQDQNRAVPLGYRETGGHALLGFWTITGLAAYTVAGEKMPWLTFHIALPMILLSGWAFGKLVDGDRLA